jgi:hypothetical protein
VCQYAFLNADLRAHGCLIASGTYAAREVSDGAAWVDAEAFAAQLRKASVPIAPFRERGTTLPELKVGYEQSPGFEGRVKPRLALQRGIDVRAQLLPMLQAGRLAIVAVNYGEIQDAGKGVGSFRGGHGVVIGEPDGSHVTVADPLRRELVRWRIDLLVRAMESFGKRPWLNGRGEAAVPLPSPTFLEQRTQQRNAARKERDAARSEADLAKAAADELRSALTAAAKRIKVLEASTTADCTAIAAERDGALERANAEADRAIIAEAKVRDAVAVLTR